MGETVNQQSARPGNDLLIATGGQTFVIPNFEDEGGVVHDVGVTESIGETIDLTVRFGPDGASSGGFNVFVTWDETVAPATTVSEESTPEVMVSSSTAPVSTAPAGPVVEDAPATTATVPATDSTAPSTTAPSTTAPSTTEQESDLATRGSTSHNRSVVVVDRWCWSSAHRRWCGSDSPRCSHGGEVGPQIPMPATTFAPGR